MISRQSRSIQTKSRRRGVKRRVASRSRARARGVGSRATVNRSRRRSQRAAVAALGGGGPRRRRNAPSFGTLAAYGLGATAVALGAAAAIATLNKRPKAPVLQSVAAVKRANAELARVATQETAGSGDVELAATPAAAELAAVQNTADAAANAALDVTRATETLERISAENERVHTPTSAVALENAMTEVNTTNATAEKAVTKAVKNVEKAKARGGWPKKIGAALVVVIAALKGLQSAVHPDYLPLQSAVHPDYLTLHSGGKSETCDQTFEFEGTHFQVDTVMDRTRGFNRELHDRYDYQTAHEVIEPRLIGTSDNFFRRHKFSDYKFHDWVQTNRAKGCLAPIFKSAADKTYYDLLVIRDKMRKGGGYDHERISNCGHNDAGFFYIEWNDRSEKQFPEDIQRFFVEQNLDINNKNDLRRKMFDSLTSENINNFTLEEQNN